MPIEIGTEFDVLLNLSNSYNRFFFVGMKIHILRI